MGMHADHRGCECANPPGPWPATFNSNQRAALCPKNSVDRILCSETRMMVGAENHKNLCRLIAIANP